MPFPANSNPTVEAYHQAIRPFDNVVESRRMFGCPCHFVNGNMMAGLFGNQIFLRLSPEDRQEFLELPFAAPFEPLPGRVMREYAMAPLDAIEATETLPEWLQRSLDFCSELPPKAPKPRRKKA